MSQKLKEQLLKEQLREIKHFSSLLMLLNSRLDHAMLDRKLSDSKKVDFCDCLIDLIARASTTYSNLNIEENQ